MTVKSIALAIDMTKVIFSMTLVNIQIAKNRVNLYQMCGCVAFHVKYRYKPDCYEQSGLYPTSEYRSSGAIEA
jgi:hypothetical protein